MGQKASDCDKESDVVAIIRVHSLGAIDNSDTRVLVTGGAGFIGCALIRKIVGMGIKTHCIDNLTYASSIDKIKSFLENSYFLIYAKQNYLVSI